jgi:hypothetical protein
MTEEEWAIAFCGLNCASCPIYLACHGDDGLRQKLADRFKGPPESIICNGCRSEPLDHDHHWSPECKMLLCAKEKGHEYCYECADFPCQVLIDFGSDGIDHHNRTVENLKRMKEMGIEAWIEDQKRKKEVEFCP